MPFLCIFFFSTLSLQLFFLLPFFSFLCAFVELHQTGAELTVLPSQFVEHLFPLQWQAWIQQATRDWCWWQMWFPRGRRWALLLTSIQGQHGDIRLSPRQHLDNDSSTLGQAVHYSPNVFHFLAPTFLLCEPSDTFPIHAFFPGCFFFPLSN